MVFERTFVRKKDSVKLQSGYIVYNDKATTEDLERAKIGLEPGMIVVLYRITDTATLMFPTNYSYNYGVASAIAEVRFKIMLNREFFDTIDVHIREVLGDSNFSTRKELDKFLEVEYEKQ